MGRGQMLLSPALNGEGRSGRQDRGNSQGDPDDGNGMEMGVAVQGQGNEHGEGGEANLQRSKLACRNHWGGMGQRQQMCSEGNGTAKRQDFSEAESGKQRSSRGSRQQNQSS